MADQVESQMQHPSSRATRAAALLGFFIITLDAVVVNVALPAIDRELSAGVNGLQWVVDGYTLMFAAVLLSAGALSDRIGARRAFGAGLAMFIASSMACGFAPNLGALIASRFVQGFAAAVMMPSSMALIGQAYPEAKPRGRAIALWALGGSVAATSGPVVGGFLAMISWRWIFFINLPVGLIALSFLMRAGVSQRRDVKFDMTGQATAVAAIGALTFGAIEVSARGLTDPRVIAALLIAICASGWFVHSQRSGTHPMVPRHLFATSNAAIAVAVGFAFMVGYFGLPFVMSLYLQQQRGMSSVATGEVFLPMMLTGLVITPLSARLVEKFTARVLVVVGLVSMAAGLALLAAVGTAVSAPVIAVLMMLVGLAGPLVAPPITAVLLNSVPAQLAGTASGLYNTSRQVGGALAVAIFGALLARSSSFEAGLRWSLFLAALVSLAVAILSMRLSVARARAGA
jgi:EmrB/QacA subfamily drug resistance transporter